MDSILIIGADGNIGKNIVSAFEMQGKNVWQTTRHRSKVREQVLFLDLSEDADQWPIPDVQFEAAFICAAVTSIKDCGNNPEYSRQVNVISAVALAKRLSQSGTFIIFLSTSAVFDGEMPFPKHTDPVNPQNEYGKHKAEAERQLQDLKGQIAIVRFSKVITPETPVLVNWIKDLKSGKKIHPFFDMVMAPISLKFAINVLVGIAEKRIPEITQVSAVQDISYSNAASYLSKQLGTNDELIQAISCKEVGVNFSPRFTALDCNNLVELELNAPYPTNALDEFLVNYI